MIWNGQGFRRLNAIAIKLTRTPTNVHQVDGPKREKARI
jgi:hypothetical protein